ncbi:MAG: hypothetical protein DWQ00_00145 [Candidatus Scalindua sp.]|nr:MAG: hypothetical protein DWQ00_00145 [Candidatus Scalindua sp.]
MLVVKYENMFYIKKVVKFKVYPRCGQQKRMSCIVILTIVVTYVCKIWKRVVLEGINRKRGNRNMLLYAYITLRQFTIKSFFCFLHLKTICILLIYLFVVPYSSTACCSQIMMKWKGNSEDDIAGYRVHYGETSRYGSGVSPDTFRYDKVTDAGTKTSLIIPTTVYQSGTTLYITATAYDFSGNESVYAEELVNVISNSGNQPPNAVDDVATTGEDTAFKIDLILNDTDADGIIDPATVAIIVGPTRGTAVARVDGAVDYTPPTGYTGQETFVYTVDDDLGETSNEATVRVIIGSSDTTEITSPISNSTLTTSAVTFQWNAGILIDRYRIHIGTTGPGSKNILKRNNLAVTLYTVTGIPIRGNIVYVRLWYRIGANWSFKDYAYHTTQGSGDQAPTANDDTATTPVYTRVSINVLANDTEHDGTIDPTTVKVLGDPTNGTAIVNVDGTVDYTPVTGYTGQDFFRYTVDDDLGVTSNEATVMVTIGLLDTPEMTSPKPSSTLTTSTVVYQWNAGTHESLYRIHVGTKGPGSKNILKRNGLITTSHTVTGIPINGKTIYVRLWYKIGTRWYFKDYAYQT